MRVGGRHDIGQAEHIDLLPRGRYRHTRCGRSRALAMEYLHAAIRPCGRATTSGKPHSRQGRHLYATYSGNTSDPSGLLQRLCTAEVRGSTPLRSTTNLQVDRGLRTPQRTPETGRCNHSATQIAALGWERTGRDGCGGDAETGPETIDFLGFSLCQCAPLASVQEGGRGTNAEEEVDRRMGPDHWADPPVARA